MNPADMCILQVSPSDTGGGAERIASDLHRRYTERDLNAWLAVGARHADGPRTLLLSPPAPAGESHMRTRMRRALADPNYAIDRARGLEDFSFPATRRLLDLTPSRPDVLHLHNLHGAYFDLRALPHLTHAVPTLVTLHDTWLTAGHCAYTLGCERWRTGCGHCPDLARPIALQRDSSAANWRRKRELLGRSHVWIAGPSQWVLDRVAGSILEPAVVEARLVPNGIDTDTFRPGSAADARRELGIEPGAFVVAFAAQAADRSPFKDLAAIRRAIPRIADGLAARQVLLVALGADVAQTTREGDTLLVPHVGEPAGVARYLQATDVYVHMAHAETLGLAILEAQACGVPVVASAVGGIPEALVDGTTGLLVPEADDVALAAAVLSLAEDPARRTAMSEAGTRHVREHHSLDVMVDAYLALYEAMTETGVHR